VVTGDRDEKSINFDRVIYRFTSAFSRSDPQEALHYLFLLCLPSMPIWVQENSLRYIRDVVLNTRQFTPLLGEMRPDGVPSGFIWNYTSLIRLDATTYKTGLILDAANESRERGKLEDAVHLYNLCGDYNAVIRIIVKKLSDGLIQGNAQLKEESSKALSFYQGQAKIFEQLDQTLVHTCALLIALMEFFALAQAGRTDAALQKIASTRLLPLAADDQEVTRAAEGLAFVDAAIKANFGDIVKTTMDILSRQYKAVKTLQGAKGIEVSFLFFFFSFFEISFLFLFLFLSLIFFFFSLLPLPLTFLSFLHQQTLRDLKAQAKNLQNLMGRIQSFQIDNEVYGFVAQQEILMN